MEKNKLPSAMWADGPNGSAIGYMCLTGFEYEIGNAIGGNRIYPDIDDLRKNAPCVDGCGIIKVCVSAVEVIQPSRDDE